MRYRAIIRGNRYHVQRRRFLVWRTVMRTHDAMLAERYCGLLSKGLPITERRTTQQVIDGEGEHRKRFLIMLSQVRSSVYGSTQGIR